MVSGIRLHTTKGLRLGGGISNAVSTVLKDFLILIYDNG